MRKVSNIVVAVWMVLIFTIVIFFSQTLRAECCNPATTVAPGGVSNNTYAHALTIGNGTSISGSQSKAGFSTVTQIKTPSITGGINPQMNLKLTVFGGSSSFNQSTGNGSGAAFSDVKVTAFNKANMIPEVCDVGKLPMKGNLQGEINNWSSAGRNQVSQVNSYGQASLNATGFIGNIGGTNIVKLQDVKSAMASINGSGTGQQGGQTKTFAQFNK